MVSTTEVLVLNSDNQLSNSLYAGELLKQSATPFSTNPLSGPYVGAQCGLDSPTGPARATLFLLTASGTGLSGTQLRNDGGTVNSKTLSGITYSVSSTGRMMVTGGGGTGPIFYLVNSNEAFALNGNPGVDTGIFQSQTGGPFSNSSASGTYAFGQIEPEEPNTSQQSGVAVFSSPNINFTEDDNSSGSQTIGGTQGFPYSIDSTGLGTVPASGSSCSITVVPTTCQTIFYIISPTKAVVMDTTSNNPKIQVADK